VQKKKKKKNKKKAKNKKNKRKTRKMIINLIYSISGMDLDIFDSSFDDFILLLDIV
jgi:hypothetical protein